MTQRAPARSPTGRWPAILGVTVLVVALAGFGAWQFRIAEVADAERLAALARLEALQAEVATAHARVEASAAEQASLARWLAQDDLRVVAISAEAAADAQLGSVVVAAHAAALVVMRDPPTEGRDHQAWGLVGDTAVSLGAFGGRVIEVDASGFDAVAVSLEPPGGSDAPTRILGAAPVP